VTRRPFNPNELDQPMDDADRVSAELESYLADTATGAPRGIEQRVMVAIEHAPAPRRGFLSWLLTPSGSNSGMRRFARAGLMAATLVIAVAGALFAGQLSGLIRNVGNGSPTPVESISPAPSESLVPSPTTSLEASPTGSPESSENAHGSPGSSNSPEASAEETPDTSPEETPDSSETPRPSKTASPSATPTSHP
jgi:hypothetical protein